MSSEISTSWTLINVFTEGSRSRCNVICTCGNKAAVRYDHFLKGRTKHCKSCSSKKTARDHGMPPPVYTGCGDLSGTFWSHIKRGAKKRNITFDITIEECWNLLVNQKFQCALSGVPIKVCRYSDPGSVRWRDTTASLDRISSEGHYCYNNVQWVHKEVNYIKRDLENQDFIEWCKAVAKISGKGGSCGS